MLNWTTPFESAANASAVFPTGTSFTSTLVSIPNRPSARRIRSPCRSRASNSAYFSLELLYVGHRLRCDDMRGKCRHNSEDHRHVGARQPGSDEGGTEVTITSSSSREHRLQCHRAGAESDDLRRYALLLHPTFFLNDPNLRARAPPRRRHPQLLPERSPKAGGTIPAKITAKTETNGPNLDFNFCPILLSIGTLILRQAEFKKPNVPNVWNVWNGLNDLNDWNSSLVEPGQTAALWIPPFHLHR